ncbi:DUF211 domain-containing protein [Halorussus caseinilyticus]|uniref:DUF211 domain-containing protein n=1 Tax=Halorussus caseinilyticus TaxID=3034025 RepID=A0ABD5WIK4_9EURY
MASVRRIVADVLKPHDPSLAEFARRMSDVEGVAGANATLIELDKEVQNVKLTVEGDDISEDRLEAAIENVGEASTR